MAAMPSDAMTAPEPDADQMDPNAPPDGDTDDTGSDPKVLLTVTKAKDGTYILIEGDEPESVDESGAIKMGDETEDAQAGQPFDTIGALLKGVLDVLKKDEGNGPDGSAQDNFNAGFTGEDKGVPTKKAAPPMPQKY